ncbi:type III secretion system gatekeeper subunit SctW [Stenotrophomonas sp. PS02289]|uniref:type III secretion system gatekeeper subunit SctW n=1 Tax=Stenotrophomonas sp. PS02289 TaxID=2991422 RepID=UPI002499E2CD|nr:type III secretion system gatekeeper subunit SctW [Stenotrophomonas sp. PS02289]
MALPAINRPATTVPVQAPRQASTSNTVEGEGETRTSTPAPRRPGALALAMAAADDASALLASLSTRRNQQNGPSAFATEAWIDHVLDEKVHQKLSGFRELLGGMRSPAQVMSLLKQLFPDPSDVLAVLRALLSDDELEAMRELLEASLEQLLEEQAAQGQGAATRGGANVAVKARLAARGTQLSARALRQSYRDFLGNPRDCAGEYITWIEQYGFERRAVIVDFMEQAIAADMFSLDPSASLHEFGYLLGQVRKLAVLRSVDQLLVHDIERTGLLSRMATRADTVVVGLLDVVRGLQDWKGLFTGPLAAARVALATDQRVRLIQALRRAVKDLPDAIWAGPEARAAAIEQLEMMVVESMKRDRGQAGGFAGGLA